MQLESKDMTNPFDVSPAGAPDRFTGLEERGMVLPEIFTCYSMLFKLIYTIYQDPGFTIFTHQFTPFLHHLHVEYLYMHSILCILIKCSFLILWKVAGFLQQII